RKEEPFFKGMFYLHNFSAFCFCVPELLFKGVEDVCLCNRAYIGRLIHGISDLQFPEAREEVFIEFRGYFLMYNEAFCRYAALSGVEHTGADRCPAGLFNVCIIKHNEWI